MAEKARKYFDENFRAEVVYGRFARYVEGFANFEVTDRSSSSDSGLVSSPSSGWVS